MTDDPLGSIILYTSTIRGCKTPSVTERRRFQRLSYILHEGGKVQLLSAKGAVVYVYTKRGETVRKTHISPCFEYYRASICRECPSLKQNGLYLTFLKKQLFGVVEPLDFCTLTCEMY